MLPIESDIEHLLLLQEQNTFNIEKYAILGFTCTRGIGRYSSSLTQAKFDGYVAFNNVF